MSDWISVKDRLPEEWIGNDKDLPPCQVGYCNDIVEGWFHTLFFMDGTWFDYNTGDEVPFIVTHWLQVDVPTNEVTT